MSIKDYVLECTLGGGEEVALKELEAHLDKRIASSKAGGTSKRSVQEIFDAERRR